jgi:sulfate/thiosulfate transport system permease protein
MTIFINSAKKTNILPGFGLTLGVTFAFLLLIALIPLSELFIETFTMSRHDFYQTVTAPRALHAYEISFGLAFLAACINAVFGLAIAWTLVRYRFPFKSALDAIVDLPFALPTSVAGIALTTLYAPHGWIGEILARWGIRIAFTPAGILVALVFIGLPFVVRIVQPVLEDMEPELEEAGAALGASRWKIFLHVTFPTIRPALLTGFTLAFARALGEYGSVIFIAGNVPNVSEIVPLLIVSKLEQYNYAGATALALTMLLASFSLLLLVNHLQRWHQLRLTRG